MPPGEEMFKFHGHSGPCPKPPLPKPAEKPTVGRIVHYVAFGTPGGEYAAGAHRAAIVTEVADDAVTLHIFNPTGTHFRAGVKHDPTHQPGTWHWPERA